MSKTRLPYTRLDLREEAVRLALTSGKRTSEIAAEPAVSYVSLRSWTKQHQVDGGNAPGVTSSEREGLRNFRREVRVLGEEGEI